MVRKWFEQGRRRSEKSPSPSTWIRDAVSGVTLLGITQNDAGSWVGGNAIALSRCRTAFVESDRSPRCDKGIALLTDTRSSYSTRGRNVSSVVPTYLLPVLMWVGGRSAGGMNEDSRASLDGQKMPATLIQVKPAPAVGLKSNGRRRSILLQVRVSAWRLVLVLIDVARGSSWAAACSR